MCTGLVLRAQQTNKQITSHIIVKAQGRACKSALVWYWEPPSMHWFNRALRRHSWATVMLWNHRAETKTTFVSSVNCELQLNVVPKKLYKSKCGRELKLSTTSNMVLLCWVKSRHRCHSSSSERHLKKVQCCSKSEKCAIYICVRVYHSKSCRTVPAKSIWRSLSMWTVSSLCHVSTGGAGWYGHQMAKSGTEMSIF